jgi:hypothetical protein
MEIELIEAPTDLALLAPAQRAAIVLNSKQTRIDLAALVKKSAGIVTVTNLDGRSECHSALMTLKNARIVIEKTGKQAREDATAFSKSVIAEEKSLVGITLAEEERLQALRDKWDADRAAELQAKIAAERLRVDDIKAKISTIAAAPVRHVTSNSSVLERAIGFYMVMPVTDSEYMEFAPEAKAAVEAAIGKLKDMQIIAAESEAAEAKRIADQQAEADRIKAERLANEQEKSRLAELAAEIERKATAEREDHARQDAIKQAAIAEQQRAVEAELQSSRDKLNAELAAREAAIKLQQDEIDRQNSALRTHAEVARLDAESLAETQRAYEQELTKEEMPPQFALNAFPFPTHDDLTRCEATVGALLADARQPVKDAPSYAAPTVDELTTLICAHYGCTQLIALGWMRDAVASVPVAQD